MNKKPLHDLFENMAPSEVQINRMREQISAGAGKSSLPARMAGSRWRRRWLAIPAACIALMLALFALAPFGDENAAYAIHVQVGEDDTLFKLEDGGKSISKVDPRPGLAFYIDGDNIARIDVTSENEFLTAKDWTETQHEKYWNIEYFQKFDEEKQVSIADFDLIYDQSMTMTFDDHFVDYGKITYQWSAHNLYKWAAQNDFSRFIGYKPITEDMSEEERMRLAAAMDTATGHIDLTGYPEGLLEDKITITITDREGKQTKQIIQVSIGSNELQQTVVTAELAKS